MTRDPFSCRPGDSLDTAAQIMWDQDCGCVPIVDAQRKLLGMITDRDIAMAAYIAGRALTSLRIEPSMSGDPWVCQETEDLEEALKSMAQAQLHRLPVVDTHGRLVGLLSMTDVVQALGGHGDRPRRKWSTAVLETLADITRPRKYLQPSKPPVASDKDAPKPRDTKKPVG
jgi:CBS-domain-containing membrane protein